jgi:DNA-binding MarR family transcriptional regulator
VLRRLGGVRARRTARPVTLLIRSREAPAEEGGRLVRSPKLTGIELDTTLTKRPAWLVVTNDALDPSGPRGLAYLARVVEKALGDAGLSLPQYRLLVFLSRGSSAASPAARDLATSRPSVTALVDGVVAKGLVQRLPDAADRRRITLALTPAGFAVLGRADEAITARLAALAAHLPPIDAERAISGLSLWIDALRAEASVGEARP